MRLAGISGETVNAFFEHYSLSDNAWSAYSSYLHSFFVYWHARRQIKQVPAPQQEPRQASAFFLYIYRREEIQTILKSTSTSQTGRRCIVNSETLKFLILFLYATGINVEDSLRLGVGEIDLTTTDRDRKVFSLKTTRHSCRPRSNGSDQGAPKRQKGCRCLKTSIRDNRWKTNSLRRHSNGLF
jgi:site-specific recombinase XerD